MVPPALRTLLVALGLFLPAAQASAAIFNEATGTVSLDGAALAWDLESLDSLPPQLSLRALDGDGNELTPEYLTQLFGSLATPPMEGASALWIGKKLQRLELDFAEPEALKGRRVEVSFWMHAQGFAVTASMAWTVGGRIIGLSRFQPTGRRTDDGWVELSTGPVDFAHGSRLVPQLVIRVPSIYGYGVAVDPDGMCGIDALEVADLGPAAVPDARCTLASEPADCGAYGICQLGRCADSAAVSGHVPSALIKDEYLDRRIFEVERFFGNRVLDETRPAYLAKMELARQATTGLGFWGNVIDAYQAVADAHGSPPYPTTTERPGIGMCVHLSEADRLPQAATWPAQKLPMVFYADASAPTAASLARGDVLTTIDDLPVDLWVSLAGPRLAHFGSPGARAVAIAPDIPAAAMRTGAKLGFSRCPAEIAATRVCQESELQKIEVDLYALYGQALWESSDTTTWVDDAFTCDYRFNRLLGEVPTGDYMHTAYGDDGPVRILEANGVPYPGWSSEWSKDVEVALSPTADNLFVIDERTGYGGTFDGVDAICAPFADPANPVVTQVVPALDAPLDEALLAVLETCYAQSGGYSGCGSYTAYLEGHLDSDDGALKEAKAAVLMSMDVSGNDWVTKLAKERPGLTRIFGPCPTFGGFGFVNSLASYLGEMSGGSAQVADSVIYKGERTSLDFESGPGVAPDEVLFQTQSDAMAGRDTLYERAKQWLQQ